jgi:hypothetical protein
MNFKDRMQYIKDHPMEGMHFTIAGASGIDTSGGTGAPPA